MSMIRLRVLGLSLLASTASGAIVDYDLFKTILFQQSSNSQPTTPVGYFGSVSVMSNNTTDFTAAEVTSTSPLSPMVLSGSAGNFTFQTPLLATKSQLDTDLPNGIPYIYDISGGTLGSESATLSTPSSDQYSATTPFFTNNAFSSLQGVYPGGSILLTWNPYATPAGINTPLIFLGITRVSDGSLAFSTSGNNLLSSVSVPANTLQPNTQYDVDLVYSARNLTANAGFGTATSFYSYDLRTDLVFTTGAAIPEPSSLSMTCLSLLGLTGWLNWKRRRGRKTSNL